MYLINLRPIDIKRAVAGNIPVIMAAGSVEYHGPHLPVGTDFLIAKAVVSRVEKSLPESCIVAPPLEYSPTMLWAGDVTEGDVDFSPDALYTYALEVFKQLAAMGFRRIYVVQHHQGPEGLPALTLRRAAAETVWQLSRGWGHSWGRKDIEDLPNPEIFNLITIAHPESYVIREFEDEPYPYGHGGKGETQLIMAAYPQLVDMEALTECRFDLPGWLNDANQADAITGAKWLNAFVDGWVEELTCLN